MVWVDLELKLMDVGLRCIGPQKLLLVLPGNHPWWPWWPWWLLRNRWCNLVSDQRALASSRPMGLRWGAATDINGRQPVTMAQVKLIQRSLPYNAQMSVQVSTVDAFQGRVAQNLVRWSQGRDMPLSKGGGYPILRPRYPEKCRKTMINYDQLPNLRYLILICHGHAKGLNHPILWVHHFHQ